MRLLLLAAIASVIGATTMHAQSPALFRITYYQLSGDSLSPDSLQMVYKQIDRLSILDLKKWHESFVYKSRIKPSSQNKDILVYIEERQKVVK